MKKLYILFACIILLSYGCADDNVKPSDDSLLATEIFGIIATIQEAYQGKNRAVLQLHMDAVLAENTIKDLLFEKAELTFNPRMVKITDASVKINLNWHGSWLFSNGKKLENRGVSDLVFDKETKKLIQIDGDSPFQTPSLR